MIEIIVAFIKNIVFLFTSTEETSTILQADDVQLHTEHDLSAEDRENQDTLEYEKEYVNETFGNEEEEEENADHEKHEDEYENDSFIIDDNGGTGDGDLTSSFASSLSGEEYQSQDEVSNSI